MRKLNKFFAVLTMLFVTVAAFAQNVKVSGTVKEKATGEGVPFAAIQIKGTNTGGVTDVDGKYEITVPSNATLVFSSVGYLNVEVTVAGKTTINVELDADTQSLEDAVVTAQGLTRREKSIGYSTVQIEGEKLTMSRQTDLGQALAGKVSGARFYSSSGATFDSGAIVIRGTSSFTSAAGSSPIYVVDGTITSQAAVNMDDVESLNILKGPAATALYGSQGGNGAVVITTKSAKAGETHIEFSHTVTAERLYNHFKLQKEYGGGSLGLQGSYYPDYLAGYEDVDTMSPEWLYGTYRKYQNPDGSFYYDYASDENWGARYDPNVKMASALYWDESSEHYMKADPWVFALDLNDLYQTGWNNTTNVAVSKSTGGHQTRISFTNSDRDGISYNSHASRRYLTIKDTFKPTKWLKFSLDYKFTYRRTKNGASEGYGNNDNPLYDFIQWGHSNVDISQYFDYKRPDGTFRTWNISSKSNFTPKWHDNPFAAMYERNGLGTSIYNVITADGEVNLPFNIKVGARLMGDLRTSESETRISNGNGSAKNWNSSFSLNQNHTRTLTYQGRMTWNGSLIQDRLGVDLAAFVEEKDYDYGTLSGGTSGGLTLEGYYNLSASVNAVSASNSFSKYKTRSVYGTATFGFDDTYFVDFSLRNDWDSRLPIAHNHYLYGGASASIMLSQFIDAPWLSFWKLRASIAQVGSTMSAYSTTYTYGAGTKVGTIPTLSMPTAQINPEIKPAISNSYEFGTEFKLFKNRIKGDLNFYRKDSKNQIMSLNVAPATGFTTRQINAGLVRNQGVEFAIGGTPVRTRNFSWDVDFNIAKNYNTLVDLYPGMNERPPSRSGFNYYWGMQTRVGEPIGVIFAEYQQARNENGEPVFQKASKAYGGYLPYFEDVKDNPTILGNFQNDFQGGFSTSFNYKSFSLGASFDYSVGGKIISYSNMWGVASGMLAESSKINDRGVNEREPISKGGGVHVTGVDTDGNPVDAYINAYQYYHMVADDLPRWCYDRTYVKMREASFSYAVPSNVLRKMNLGISSASISLVASNPWLIYSAIPNVDASEASSNWIEGGQAPATRSFGATVRLVF